MNAKTRLIQKRVKQIAEAEAGIQLPAGCKEKFNATLKTCTALKSSSIGAPNPVAMRALIDWAHSEYQRLMSEGKI